MDLKVLVLFTAIAAILLKFILNYLKARNSVKNIDGPTSIPLIGNIELAFLTNTNQLQWFFKNTKNFQKYFKMWLGTELWVVIYDPEMAEKVLTNPKLIKSNDYVFLKPWLGKGLLLNEGQKWFGRRKAITPAFHFNILEDFLEIFAQNTDVLMEKFDTDKPVNVPPLFLKCAFDVICETSMGLKMNSQNESNVPYVKAVNDITNIAYKRIMNPLTAIDWVFKLTKDHKIFEDSLKVVSETTQKVISERRKYYAEHPDELQESTNELGVRKRMPLIDTLLKAHVDGQPLSNRDIEDEVNTFLFAGHDTTSHTLGYFFYNVAKHPEVQEKIFEEVSNVFGGIPENNELTTRKINELKYLEAVIKESMRLYATVPFIGRKLLEDTTIGNLNLPACTNINIFMYGIFKNEKLFKDPEKFVPDRFSHDNPESKKINPFAFIPFSAGPRNCIGQKFALLEMKTIILKSICKYTFSLADPNADLEVFQSIVLKAKNGVHLKFKKRV